MPMQATTTTPLFAAALKPNRSPRVTGGWVAFAVAAIMATPLAVLVPEALLPAGVAFVVGGGGLGMLSWREKRARQMRQQVTLWPGQLEVVTTAADGSRAMRRFDPQNVRLALERDENEKPTGLYLRAGRDALELGAFLDTEDRSSFAKAFGTALRRARKAD